MIKLHFKKGECVHFDKDFISDGHFMLKHSALKPAKKKITFFEPELTARFFYLKPTNASFRITDEPPNYKSIIHKNIEGGPLERTALMQVHPDGMITRIYRDKKEHEIHINIVYDKHVDKLFDAGVQLEFISDVEKKMIFCTENGEAVMALMGVLI